MRYAKALMAYAEERGAEERLYHELVTLAHSFRTVKGFCAVLDNPIVSVNEKFNLICTAADGDHKPSEEFIRFIQLVLKERRETYLQFMSLMYLDLYRKKKRQSHSSHYDSISHYYSVFGSQNYPHPHIRQQPLWHSYRWRYGYP